MTFIYNRLPFPEEVESGFVILSDHELFGVERLLRDYGSWPDFCSSHGGAYCPVTNEPIALGWAPIPKGPRSPSACISELAAFAFEVVNLKHSDSLGLKAVKQLMEKYNVSDAAEACEVGYNESCPEKSEIRSRDVAPEDDRVVEAFRYMTSDATWESC